MGGPVRMSGSDDGRGTEGAMLRQRDEPVLWLLSSTYCQHHRSTLQRDAAHGAGRSGTVDRRAAECRRVQCRGEARGGRTYYSLGRYLPFSSVPFRSVPFRSVPFRVSPAALRSTPLSTPLIPIARSDPLAPALTLRADAATAAVAFVSPMSSELRLARLDLPRAGWMCMLRHLNTSPTTRAACATRVSVR